MVLLLTLGTVGALPSGQAVHDGLPDVLWLRGDPGGGHSHNFTTYPPEANDTGEALDLLSGGNYSDISFAMPLLPGAWAVEPGSDIELEIWVSGLDRVIAMASPLTFAEEPNRVIVQAELVHGTEGRFAFGRTSIQPDPIEPQEVPRRLIIPLGVERSVAYAADSGTEPGFELTLTVFGHSRPEHDLLVHVRSPETPSHIELPMFPVGAFREWEEVERERRDCAARILGQEPCRQIDETPNGPVDDNRQVVLPWFLGFGALGVASAGILWYGRRQ